MTGGLDAARERELARRTGLMVDADVRGPVDTRERRTPGRRKESVALARLAHSGMFPCFFGGLESRLPCRIASAAQSRARVSWGSITSSM